jgi:hypothetical protein
MTLAAFALSYLAFVTLGLTQVRHHRRVHGCVPGSRRRRAGRWAGWMLLAASAGLTAGAWGPATAAVAFPGVVTVTAVAVAVVLTYAPHAVSGTRAAAAAVAVGASVGAWMS